MGTVLLKGEDMNDKNLLERLKTTLWFAENDNMLSATIWTSDLKEIVELLSAKKVIRYNPDLRMGACPTCGYAMAQVWNYCHKCGTRLEWPKGENYDNQEN